MFKPTRILITGGCGFIGTNIALEARKRGYGVVCFDSFVRLGVEENVPVLEKAGVDIVRGDVRNKEDFERIGNFDAVIHLAGNTGIGWSFEYPAYDFNVNVVGTINALEQARKKNAPLIFASTNKVYSDKVNEVPVFEKEKRYFWGGDGINENFPTDTRLEHTPYGASKLSADLYVQEYFHAFNIPTVVNRMSCIYGHFQKGIQDQGWVDHFIRRILLGDGKIDIFGDGKQVRDVLWGGDVARLYVDELENIGSLSGMVFNVGGGVDNTLSLIEAIEAIEEVSGKKAALNYKGWRHADQKVYISNTELIRSLLPWKPEVSPKEGIAKIVEKYKETYGLN